MWEESFVAVSVLLGRSVEDAIDELSSDGQARVAGLVLALGDPRRAARAAALARVSQRVAFALDEATLR